VAAIEPARYREVAPIDLLRAAAAGRAGVDRRFIQSLLDRGPETVADALAFTREPRGDDRIRIEPLLIDLFRHFSASEAIGFYIGAIRADPEEIDESLIEAVLRVGEPAVQPLLDLYEEIGEEQGSDIAFLLASLRVHDPRVLAVLLDRLEYDAADGAFCLGLYGDPAALPALEKLLAEFPDENLSDDDIELKREIAHAIELIGSPTEPYQAESFDIFADYPDHELPQFDVLTEPERIEMLAASDPEIRAGAAYSFFNTEVSQKVREALLHAAKSDPDANVRGRAWESLADATGEAPIRDTMIAILKDTSLPVEERGGAAVGLYGVADRQDVRAGVEAMYEEGGAARAKALETMWRSLWKPYAKYFAPHLEDADPAILKQALRGAGYFRLTGSIDKIAKYLEDEDLRDDALFAYAVAMPGETTRGRARGMLRRVDSVTQLSPSEVRLVAFAIDERLRLQGLEPVFENDSGFEEEETPAPPPPAQQGKPGRNDPCPCGSGKKYKKCHGA
jgi:HEAT repeat protein